MRIQHNIMAMNSYRNLNGNNNALSKNLEKLSSGYRINRAGDDAAGLAISEKMRAQIAGLDQAQKNAQSGINLVKTAEGALTEVHDMLNRMVTLANQSANGTYNNTDRQKLQAEVDALVSEIDRIAENSNFNGTKLLDGSVESLKGATSVKTGTTFKAVTPGTQFSQTLAIATTTAEAAEGTSGTMQLSILNADGATSRDATISFTYGKDAATTAENMKNALQDVFGDDYNVSTSSGTITVKANAQGKDDGKIVSATMYDAKGVKIETNKPTVNAATAGTDAKWTLATADLANKSKIEIDGKKFQIVKYTDTVEDGYTAIYLDSGASTTKETAQQVAAQLKSHGINAKESSTAGAVELVQNTKNTSTGGLTLQIGDTADAHNQMLVGISDMHSTALGIKGLNISTQSGAAAAVTLISTAIDAVSANRGNLGAIQNRLEHTINNLSVMEENIQDAESNIRDTDVADEMMAYTKNNILIQSAQAMLAQANQVPQGVLQLMQ